MKLAVIPTHNRFGDYWDCYQAIAPQVDEVITISHRARYPDRGVVIEYDKTVPNISEMWNLGLDEAERMGGEYVAVLNDDAIVPPDWFDVISVGMKLRGSAAGSAWRPTDSRMAGHAFILDVSAGLRADEQFAWWYGDDDLERRARELGGVYQATGLYVEHRHPNSTTVGELADVAAEDATRYRGKWG